MVEASRLLLLYNNAVPIAGGTDLSIQMDKKADRSHIFVDLMGLGWNYISFSERFIRIGATTTFTEILASDLIQEKLPILNIACGQIGSLQCRSMATIGGNLCSAVPSADSATPLLVLDAVVELASVRGARSVPLSEFFTGPRKTILERGEIMHEIQIPVPSTRSKSVFIKFGRRKAVTLSTVNVAVHSSTNEQMRCIEHIRIALGAVAPTPVRAARAEKFLEGKQASSDAIDDAIAIALTEISPISDIRASKEFRLDISHILLKRALTKALEIST
jgi:Aerobic-type carbon monoxide dehydrogenase, middle subunit CoxM/CutM homologs